MSETTAKRQKFQLQSGVSVVLGAQWGDEGKGKLVDILAAEADVVCRCQVEVLSNCWREFRIAERGVGAHRLAPFRCHFGCASHRAANVARLDSHC